ncbi:putative methyltransferase [Enterococcus sp. PF1-24]|uniref:class I SAM-dependent methyltransferase n=1 Tax=unclassified Enterococcus TaxID=2608891 RepID=UPI002475D19F|nr:MULTISPECIES: class I SAM-dependent methyltransferase [unclassified Enterococcus]MDH6363394.1 putative methyltransferase [Enterococcus sp. PFB1-1]MDH6400488.1 putative methyltransferase [Enterococcus sp. PF1-24]
MLATALHYSHTLLKEVVEAGDTVVDATMGNGNDTLLLAQLVGENGKVYSFDVQASAVANTQARLAKENLLSQSELLLQGHETLAAVLPAETTIKACIFNLGYLPKSDKQIITLPATTKQALDAALTFLAPKGRVIIVAYYGHDGGAAELSMVEEYCQTLPQEAYSVLRYQFINQRNSPPILFCIEKKA